eukprot:2896251-Prymnesium_polylepis.3
MPSSPNWVALAFSSWSAPSDPALITLDSRLMPASEIRLPLRSRLVNLSSGLMASADVSASMPS